MSDRQKNNASFVLQVIIGLFTVCGTLILVGSLKGEITTTIMEHGRRIEKHDEKIDHLSTEVAKLDAHVHGVASQVGAMPAKVVAKLQEAHQ